MPTYRFGNIWSEFEQADAVCVTTNSAVYGGRLVMGGGIALEARQRFPGIESVWGKLILQDAVPNNPFYGTIWSVKYPKLVALQTKVKPEKPSIVRLIKYSINDLMNLAQIMKWQRVDLPFPGIGLGGLPVERVLPIVDVLPEMFHVWRFKHEEN